uniref:Uncharacterized protein LOC114348170 n=1 Tax=Diabrotica virgifera virgifera TaxID=50390 RepID=A0A6P7H7N9_DIAVI
MGVTDYFFNYLLQILFNSSMPNLDKITGYVKYLLMLWVFCMSVNNTQFNSLLTSMLVSSRSKEPIKTIEELSKSNFRIYVHEYFVGRGYIPNSLGLDQKLIRIDEQPENMLYSNVTIGNQYAFVVRIDAAKFFINSHRNKDGQSQYAIMKESLIPGIDGYTLQKNSPLVNQFNKCLLLIKQHGLINFQSSSNYGKAKPNQPENLNIKHLLSLVGLYLVGNCFAFLVFIAEVLWKKYKT